MYIPTDGPRRTCVTAVQQANLSLDKGGISSSLPEISKAVGKKACLILESSLSGTYPGSLLEVWSILLQQSMYPQFLPTWPTLTLLIWVVGERTVFTRSSCLLISLSEVCRTCCNQYLTAASLSRRCAAVHFRGWCLPFLCPVSISEILVRDRCCSPASEHGSGLANHRVAASWHTSRFVFVPCCVC